MKNLKFIGINLLLILGLLGLAELSIAYLLNHPSKIPSSWMDSMRSYYMQKDRKIAQFDEELAEYDPNLFYHLRPGIHRFSNREFDTEMKVNSFGFRDEEAAVKEPEVIFLGDSYTMGWGTEADENFPSLVAKRTGLRTLNTGVSSYGTVREFELLKTLDTSQLKYLIIQYDFNDFGENTDFYFNHNSYQASPKPEYENLVHLQSEATRYFPFKHISHFTRNWFDTRFPKPKELPEPEEEQPYVDQWTAFMNVLKQASIPKNVEIMVIQVGSEHHQEVFIHPLMENATSDSLLGSQIRVLDLQKLLNEEQYYLLDRHLKPSGHAIVANALVEEINKLRKFH